VAGLRLCCQARRWVSLLSRADGNREGPAQADVMTAIEVSNSIQLLADEVIE
jgi:hypothetical protein